jgi:hypothetical protein
MTAGVSVNKNRSIRTSAMTGIRLLLWILPCVVVYRMMTSPKFERHGATLAPETAAVPVPATVPATVTASTTASTTNRTGRKEHEPVVVAATNYSGGVVPIPIADTFGAYDDTGRLVVQTNETHMFWQEGQKRLCRVLRLTTNVKELGASNSNWHHSHSHSNANPRPVVPLVQMTVDCVGMAHNTWFGQGNWVSAFYVVRMAAILAKVDFQFQCLLQQPNNNNNNTITTTSSSDQPNNLLMPLFQGYYAAPTPPAGWWPYNGKRPHETEVCTHHYYKIRIDKMTRQIQTDMRTIARKLVGGDDPLYSNITLDDVAIHFRCGDVLGGAPRNDFGMIPFREYKKYVFRNATSIGILTQPFTLEDNRDVDQDQVADCEIVVHRLVQYLQDFMPNGTIIRIHNDPTTETLPLAWARLTLARQQAFTTLSSFGIFPVIGTLGQGYFQKGNTGINPWSSHVPKHLPNMHVMKGNVMGTFDIGRRIREKGLESMLEWFEADE